MYLFFFNKVFRPSNQDLCDISEWWLVDADRRVGEKNTRLEHELIYDGVHERTLYTLGKMFPTHTRINAMSPACGQIKAFNANGNFIINTVFKLTVY